MKFPSLIKIVVQYLDLSSDSEAQPITCIEQEKMNIAEMRLAKVLTKAFSIASHFRPVVNTRLLALIGS